MTSDRENALVASRVGLLLAVGMLAFLALGWGFRGYDPARLALALVPVALGLAGAGAGTYLSARPARALVPAARSAAAAAPAALGVTVTVLETKGTCPMGFAFQAGDRWTIQGDLESAAGLCPRAREAVRDYLVAGESGALAPELPRCLTKRHRAIFDVQRLQAVLVATR